MRGICSYHKRDTMWISYEGYKVVIIRRILSGYHTVITSGYPTRNMVVIIQSIYMWLSYGEYSVYHTGNMLVIPHTNIWWLSDEEYVVIKQEYCGCYTRCVLWLSCGNTDTIL